MVLFLCELRRRLDGDGFQQSFDLVLNVNKRARWCSLPRVMAGLLLLLLYFGGHNWLFFDLWWEGYRNLEWLTLAVVDLVQIAGYVLSNQHISFVSSLVLVELLGNQNNQLLLGVLGMLIQELLHILDTHSIIESPCIIFH